jgi:outer membrane lipoprotein SlyB
MPRPASHPALPIRSRLRRGLALLTAGAMLAGCVTTREQRIGGDAGDACRTQLVALDSTGNFFAADMLRGAAIGAVGGAALGALLAAATGQRGSGIAAGAGIGAVAGGVVGGTAGYLSARQQQATDQASLNLAVANDLAAENAQLDRTQVAFDQLMDCRFNTAQQIRAELGSGRMARPQAEAAMAELRNRTQRDIQLANTINGQIGRRGAEFDTAIETVAPGVKQAASMPKPAVPARPRATVALRLRPDPASPEVARVPAREAVTLRPGRDGFAQVETASGVRGYAPSQSFPEATRLGDAAPVAAQGSDVRSLAASNIARRDNFSESVGTATRLAEGQGFELAT